MEGRKSGGEKLSLTFEIKFFARVFQKRVNSSSTNEQIVYAIRMYNTSPFLSDL